MYIGQFYKSVIMTQRCNRKFYNITATAAGRVWAEPCGTAHACRSTQVSSGNSGNSARAHVLRAIITSRKITSVLVVTDVSPRDPIG